MITKFSELSRIHEFKAGPVTIRYEVPDNGAIVLNSIRTQAGSRNKGFARKALESFLEYTDSLRRDVSLLASPLNAKTSLGRLVSFYKSLGFVETGKHNFAFEPYLERKHK